MRKAVVLMNLGSPDSTSIKDVRRYLDEFLMDARVIDKPWLLRAFLVKCIIVPLRAPRSSKTYQSVWTDNGSPLIVISKALQEVLNREVEQPVVIAMRYGNPSPLQAFTELVRNHPDLEDVLLIPMYPHYAMSSYETALEYANEQHEKGKFSFNLSAIKPFYNEANYIEALSESIRPFVEKEYDQILFSYHGIPERHVQKTDPTRVHCLKTTDCCEVASPAHQFCYRHQCLVTAKSVVEKLNIPANKWSMSFQSRLGRDPWLKPYTVKRLEQLPAEGIKKLIVVCPAFVSDCLETLEEMGIEGKEVFLHAGGEQFDLVPCLNIDSLWVKTLANWVEDYAKGNSKILV